MVVNTRRRNGRHVEHYHTAALIAVATTLILWREIKTGKRCGYDAATTRLFQSSTAIKAKQALLLSTTQCEEKSRHDQQRTVLPPYLSPPALPRPRPPPNRPPLPPPRPRPPFIPLLGSVKRMSTSTSIFTFLRWPSCRNTEVQLGWPGRHTDTAYSWSGQCSCSPY